MEASYIDLKILLPHKVFKEVKNVTRMVAETKDGQYGLLPNRLDCVMALEPGIFTYETEKEGEKYVAVDEGVLIKTGPTVFVAVRNAIGGTDLGKLKDSVKSEFLNLDEKERDTRISIAKLESSFIHSFEKLRKED